MTKNTMTKKHYEKFATLLKDNRKLLDSDDGITFVKQFLDILEADNMRFSRTRFLTVVFPDVFDEWK